MEADFQEMDIEDCQSCGKPLDVSSFAPFTKVQCPSCGVQVRVKSKLGNYEITRRQGTGGMSLVFAATDMTLGRQVAIKLLNEDYSRDAKRIEEFEKEAKITAAISHPNVVRVYTVGQAYGRYYIAMELVEGDSLEQRMNNEGRLDEKFLVQLAIEVVEGLKAAHGAGLIHRDMKPGNVLIDAKGRAKIVDFGLALMTSGGKVIAEEIWATPYYVPPETLRLEEEDLRSDIYALGSSIYHAISDSAPFTTETRSTSELLRIKQNIPKLAKVAEGASSYFCEVIDKTMEFDSAQRFQSYEELLRALKQIELYHRTGKTPEPLSEPQVDQTSRRVRKKKSPVPMIAGVAVLLAAAGGAFWHLKQPEPAPVVDEPAPAAVVDDEDDAAVEQESMRALIAAELRNAQNLLYASQYKNAHEEYFELALNEHLESETVYWTGLRSVIAAFLNGESREARKVIREVLSKQRKSDAEMSEVDKKLQKALRKLQSLETITPDDLRVTGDSLDVMIVTAAGLKEWEQGKWDEAMVLFALLDEVSSSSDQISLEFFQKVIEVYQSDFVLLKPFYKGMRPNTAEEAKSLLSQVLSATDKIKTRGRAPYNHTQWVQQLVVRQNEIEQEKERLAAEKEAARLAAIDLWNTKKQQVQEALKVNRFIVARQALEATKGITEKDEQWRKNTLYMCQAAEELFDATHQALEEVTEVMTLRRLDGRIEYEKLVGATERGLLVETKQKDVITLFWRDVSPYTMLELQKQISLAGLNDEEKMRRRECLAWYFWLTGIESTANAAADTLSKVNEEFAQRWSQRELELEE